jgi:hypothetical protein
MLFALNHLHVSLQEQLTFCLAVCCLLHYFSGQALVSLSYLLSIPHCLQQQDMTNKIIMHMYATQTMHMYATQTLLLILILTL